MDEQTVHAVERAISFMRQNLADRITVDDMAQAAQFSKFYFTRLFQRVTGVSPARYLSALRLEKAMRLLLNSSSTVADISYQVGYNSPGTFSSRFRSSVGVSPITFRQLGGYTSHLAADSRVHRMDRLGATIRGSMRVTEGGRRGFTFVGLFRDPIPQGPPASCALLPGPGPFVLNDVPNGKWFVHAQSIAIGAEENVIVPKESADAPYVGSCGPIVMRRDASTIVVELLLRPQRTVDPPVLLAPVDVRSDAMRNFRAENVPDVVSVV
ncbi:AraC-type DNA-binding protein [Saccharopolyspora antimicrobica]|uniref:AraC-like DNA-binding protein n=1 Tax=Saccharopolyspora antimicrobica TaxID=455193 RepID=A0A1I4VU18_9PSEU|nr:AraC family transcriptional regulator [Saccharopolyspora antimicrobica]RKT87215.1 AraC-like DNA-binding protein [Saccharopolyspora antimicrobica]SFN04539.1 AraC-type DNA-binding protein [Saccharopolyspora antimicrobica]